MAVLISLAISGCAESASSEASSQSEASGQSLKSAFMEYESDVTPLLERVDELNDDYASVSGENYTTDQKLYSTVKRDMPKWAAVVEDIAAVDSPNAAINDVHDILVNAAQSSQRAMTLVLDALEAQDPKLVAEANDTFAEAQALVDAYEDAIANLPDEG